jgi:hypothetical protein
MTGLKRKIIFEKAIMIDREKTPILGIVVT